MDDNRNITKCIGQQDQIFSDTDVRSTGPEQKVNFDPDGKPNPNDMDSSLENFTIRWASDAIVPEASGNGSDYTVVAS